MKDRDRGGGGLQDFSREVGGNPDAVSPARVSDAGEGE